MFPAVAGRSGGGTAAPLLLVLLLGVCWAAQESIPSGQVTTQFPDVRPPPPMTGDYVPDLLRTLLRAMDSDNINCSTVIFADHTTIANDVLKGLGAEYGDGGVIVLRIDASLKAEDDKSNKTNTKLDKKLMELMAIGQWFRKKRNCYNVIFATDSIPMMLTLMQHSTDDRLLLWADRGIIITGLPESLALDKAKTKWAFSMMNFYMLAIPNSRAPNSLTNLYRWEPYSPEGPRARKCGEYTPEGGLLQRITAPIHYEKFDNFFGAKFNFTTLTYLPFISVHTTKHPNGTHTYIFGGTDYEIFKLQMKRLNFTPNYMNHTTSWREVEDAVTFRRALHVTCMYFMTTGRLKRFGVIAPYTTKELAFAMRRPGAVAAWDSFMYPYLTEVWFIVLVLLIVLSVCLVITLKYSSADDVITSKLRGGMQVKGKVAEIPAARAVLELFGALVGQDFVFKMPNTHSFRILLTGWFIFIIVLSTGYKSKLISFMTKPKEPYRPENLEELVASKATVTAPPYGVDHQELLEASQGEGHRIIAERYKFVASMVVGLQMAIDNGTANLNKRLYQSYTIADKFTGLDGSSQLYLGREPLFRLISSLPITIDAPYQKQFDKTMLGVVQGGLYDKWHKVELEKLRIRKVEKAKKDPNYDPSQIAAAQSLVKPLRLPQVKGPNYVIMFGGAVGTLALIGELIAARYTEWKKK